MKKDRITHFLLHLTKPIMTHIPLGTTRKMQDMSGDAMLKKYKISPDYRETEDSEIIFAKGNSNSDTALFYIHGGAFVAGSSGYIKGVTGLLSCRLGMDVYGCDYRLAPEHPFPEGLEDAFRFYVKYKKTYKNMVLIGDSAGGGMIFSLCALLKGQGETMPYALVAFSPWTDLTFSGKSYEINKNCDPTISKKELISSAISYIGDDRADNPLISPAFCDCIGFPKSLIFVGSDEVLLSDSMMMHENLLSHGVHSEIEIGQGMWHVYPFFPTRYEKFVFNRIKEFITND